MFYLYDSGNDSWLSLSSLHGMSLAGRSNAIRKNGDGLEKGRSDEVNIAAVKR
jgi:hypothetical protein